MTAAPLTRSVARLAPLGRFLYDRGTDGMWDRDTATLPRHLRRRRRAYRRFAADRIAPLAASADADPEGFDPRPLLAEAGRRGFQSELLPPPLGTMPWPALGSSMLLHVMLRAEEFCAACGGIGLALLAHDLGAAPLLLSGDLAVWQRWLIPINRANRRGDPVLCAFAITEPAAGSDVEDSAGAATARFGTTATRSSGGYRIDGQKVFITGGAHADLVCVFAVLEPDTGGPGGNGRGGVDTDWTCFVVERGTPGFGTGRREHKLGQRAADATELFFDGVEVPAANRVGPERSGWALNRNVLNYSRGPVGAIATGIARGAAEAATEYCRTRRLGNRPLAARQEVQLALAEIWCDVMAMRAMVWQAGRQRRPNQGVASATKAFCGDTAFRVATRAMALLADDGGLGANRVEKAMRDARLNQIYEGTNQLNRLAMVEAFPADFGI